MNVIPNADLDKAWQRERRLTRTAAHELKNDLTNILHGIDRTDRLIQQLLMLSKVEAEQVFHPEPIEVMACLLWQTLPQCMGVPNGSAR